MANMVNIGFGNVVSVERIVAIMTPESAQTKRVIARAKEEGKFLDGSHGRRTRSVVIMDSGHVIFSGLMPQTIGYRVARNSVAAVKDSEEKVEKVEEEKIAEDNGNLEPQPVKTVVPGIREREETN